MIPGWHRRKGGAALLGASTPGEAGPFGVFSDDGDDVEGEEVGPGRVRHAPARRLSAPASAASPPGSRAGAVEEVPDDAGVLVDGELTA